MTRSVRWAVLPRFHYLERLASRKWSTLGDAFMRSPTVEGRRAPSRALTAAEYEMVSQAAERIIPRTTTPGATDARVADFIHVMLADWYNDSDRTRFKTGLSEPRCCRTQTDGAWLCSSDGAASDRAVSSRSTVSWMRVGDPA